MPTPAEIATTLQGFEVEIRVMPEALDQTQKDRLSAIASDLDTAVSDTNDLEVSVARKNVVKGRIETANNICGASSASGELLAADNAQCTGSLAQAAGILNTL